MANGEGIIFGIIIGIIAYVCLDVGKGIQKYAIEGFKEDKTVKSKNSGIWIFGTILTSLYMFIQWAALFFAPINLIAPLEGIGLVVLLIFSYYVLKEQITKIEIVGVICIIAGTVVITLFNPNTGEINATDFNLNTFLLFALPILGIEVIAIIISKFKDYKFAGLIIGTTAGTLSALQTFTKRVTAIPEFFLIFTGIMFTTAVLTLAVTQFALAKANANVVVPCFSSASIVLATLSGVIALTELIEPIQILGIAVIVLGVIFLTAFKKKEIREIEESE
jgi:drug/metabolite transporter (DMT)-like permease